MIGKQAIGFLTQRRQIFVLAVRRKARPNGLQTNSPLRGGKRSTGLRVAKLETPIGRNMQAGYFKLLAKNEFITLKIHVNIWST